MADMMGLALLATSVICAIAAAIIIFLIISFTLNKIQNISRPYSKRDIIVIILLSIIIFLMIIWYFSEANWNISYSWRFLGKPIIDFRIP